ncbi:MAG: ATP synthase F0 subunit C [Clostridia bacterium]|jgi:F-type H+-transporting ATPase subunit c|nr:ATP synthase F0 subunit C [Oscillospiraceae bacterium]MBO5462163.1 ATP synthase F0 subunit C [Clostridia bacterium]MBE6814526.1 ATP synthase F0 subunit C [Oscillospiraceae bacterium]MBQ4103835.1 ATP synthase F0 subunit C [Clostridia bacterium]MBQ6935014.1 ATP synthase F0 subunit C [Clostridia bacterium]
MGSAIAMLTALGAGFGMCFATAKAVESVARQPEAASKIQTILLLGCALAESTAIYAFVVALILSGK